MRFKLRCCNCGCTYWRNGEDDLEVNAVTITDDDDSCPDCGGDNYIIVDQEYPEREPDDVL